MSRNTTQRALVTCVISAAFVGAGILAEAMDTYLGWDVHRHS
jgi:hypothetical protein